VHLRNLGVAERFGTRGLGASTARLKSGAAKAWVGNYRRRAEIFALPA
jgi:hypothetical protein